MINENLIPAYNGTNFEINKVTKVNSDNEEYVISELKYKTDVIHRFYNAEITSKIKAGDCNDCGFNDTNTQYNGATWGDILVLGLGLGLLPEYIKINKGITSIDVIESDAEIIEVVNWINSDINVINGNEFTHTLSKQYDIIICDLWAEPDDISQDHKTNLVNNYNSNLKSGGRIIIPMIGETIS
tara:strand:+ start:423 stop:977 length:555 start_codon:yes stop_codon:yes gene_type:complete